MLFLRYIYSDHGVHSNLLSFAKLTLFLFVWRQIGREVVDLGFKIWSFGHLAIWSTPLLCHPSLAIHIQWENSTLNHQLYHVNLKLFLYIFLLLLVFFSQSHFVTHFKFNFVLCTYYSELKMTVLPKHVFF